MAPQPRGRRSRGNRASRNGVEADVPDPAEPALGGDTGRRRARRGGGGGAAGSTRSSTSRWLNAEGYKSSISTWMEEVTRSEIGRCADDGDDGGTSSARKGAGGGKLESRQVGEEEGVEVGIKAVRRPQGRYNLRARIPRGVDGKQQVGTQDHGTKGAGAKVTGVGPRRRTKRGVMATVVGPSPRATKNRRTARALLPRVEHDDGDGGGGTFDGHSQEDHTAPALSADHQTVPTTQTDVPVNHARLLQRLGYGSPRVHVNPYNAISNYGHTPVAVVQAYQPVSSRLPPLAARVMARFEPAVVYGVGTLPWALRGQLTATDGGNPLPEHLFQPQPPVPPAPGAPSPSEAVNATMGANILLAKAQAIVEHAAAVAPLLTEAGWQAVNARLLRHIAPPHTVHHPPDGIITILNVSGDTLDPTFLPRITHSVAEDNPIPACKIPLGLGVPFGLNDISTATHHLAQPDLLLETRRLNVTNAAYITLLPVEVKSAALASYGEGMYNVAVYSAASLIAWARLQARMPLYQARELPPIPSIVTVGHDWFLHWAFWDRQQAARGAAPPQAEALRVVTFMGPYHVGTTLNVVGTLKILDILRRLKRWFEENVEWNGGSSSSSSSYAAAGGDALDSRYPSTPREPGLFRMLLDLLEAKEPWELQPTLQQPENDGPAVPGPPSSPPAPVNTAEIQLPVPVEDPVQA